MKRVQFLKNTADARIDAPPKTLVIYRDGFGYTLPDVSGADYIEFSDYKVRYTTFAPEMIVMVGLNRMINPSNRCDMVNEYLQTMTNQTPKVCIDTAPFIGEPWRLWWHFDIANVERWGVPHSYAIETEWKSWFYREVPTCRLASENIRLFLADVESDLYPLSVRFSFSDVGQDDEEWYAAAKASVFERHNTPKMWINGLLRLSNKRYGLNISMDSYRAAAESGQRSMFGGGDKIEVPDLGVYRFVVEENRRRMAIYNEVINFERR